MQTAFSDTRESVDDFEDPNEDMNRLKEQIENELKRKQERFVKLRRDHFKEKQQIVLAEL